MALHHCCAAFGSCAWLVVLTGFLSVGWATRVTAGTGPSPTLGSRSMPVTCRAGSCTPEFKFLASPVQLKLWFPKWVPGTHGPNGPVQNVGGLRFETPEGKPLDVAP